MNQLSTILIVFALFGVQTLYGQNKKEWTQNIPEQVCYASEKTNKSFTPPPKEFLLKSGGEKKSEMIVSYSLFPQEAKAAFEYAIEIWEYIIESEIPIYVQANWRTKKKTNLGSAAPTDFKTDFEFIPHEGHYYPIVIAEKISRKNMNSPNTADFRVTFNKTVNWYFGTDGNTPEDMYDFVSVALHEIGHGLGFTGFYDITDEGLGTSYRNKTGDITGFDILITNYKGEYISDTNRFENPSKLLGSVLQSGILLAESPIAKSRNNGIQPRLFAPAIYDDGSSIYHLNDKNYEAGSKNALMTHSLSKGEANHDPGPLTRGILDDIGWSNVYIKFKKLKDIEATRPVQISAAITSDYLLDTASIFAIYSSDNFKNHMDSIPLIYNDSFNIFAGVLTPNDTTKQIKYYVVAGDSTKRKFAIPTEAPHELYTLRIAPDNQIPEIEHSPIPYFILNEDFQEVRVNADDNIGIDTIFVEYSINGVPQTSFGLNLDTLISYSAPFNFDKNTLKDGDVIAYKIVARDSSKAKNIAIFPSNDNIEFKIEEIFEPVESYFSDFNKTTSDFLLNDFDIYKDEGFESAALHSFHPYPSPNKNDQHFDLFTFLKRPIILSEGGSMSFDEIVLVEPGEESVDYPDQDFYDYVVVEGSKDMGETWQNVTPGYDSSDRELWETVYNEHINEDKRSTNTGNSDLFISREIDLLANGNFNAGDTILIRFRLYSDPLSIGWGWAIDNLRIQQPVSSNLIKRGNVVSVYPNPFSNELKISFETQSVGNNIEFEIINLFGQKVYRSAYKQSAGRLNEVLNLSDLHSGIYILTIKENGKFILNKKIIKGD